MRTKSILTAILILSIGLLVWLLGFNRPVRTESESSEITKSDGSQSVLSAKAPGGEPSVPGSSAAAPLARQQSTSSPSMTMNEHKAEWSNMVQNWSQQIHRPIEFYGKVVDENGQPVEGANIDFSWVYYHPEASFTTNTLSDRDGLFALKGVVGAEMVVYAGKPGYYTVKSLNQINFSYSELPGQQPFHPDPNNPIVFHLRKKGQGADLITSQHGVFPDLEFSGPRDGSTVRVDFFNQKVGTEGQLELSSVKPPRGQAASKWSFRLSVPDGGLIEENDEFPFEAPASGYQSMIEFDFKAGEINWTDTLHKHYYIVFGQPPKYGRIDVETGAYMGVDLGYTINPDDTRNLEPKEASPFHQEPPPGVTEVIPPERLK
jgi:hypothetical protein